MFIYTHLVFVGFNMMNEYNHMQSTLGVTSLVSSLISSLISFMHTHTHIKIKYQNSFAYLKSKNHTPN